MSNKPLRSDESIEVQRSLAADTPSHPKLAATLLMIGIVVFIIAMSLRPLL